MNLAVTWPWALAIVLILAVVVVIVLVRLLRKSSKVSQFADAEEPIEEVGPSEEIETTEEQVVGLSEAFTRAKELLDRVGDGDPHHVPFYLLVGAEGARDADLLSASGLDLPWGTPGEAGMSLGNGRGFHFFERGVVLDMAGESVLRADGVSSDEKGWNQLMQLLQQLRPRRPIDGVIVTLPCGELLDASVDEARRAELATRAGRIFRKLWEAQQRLGFRLPAYVVVSGCERLTGFTSLCASLPAASLDDMIGWSSPYSVETAYRGRWIDEAFAMLNSRLHNVQMELFTEGATDPDNLLRLPSAILALAAPVRAYADNLFKSSAYHGSLIFRGLYFCGRSSGSANQTTAGRTAFLRDLLERKVLPECGLASPTARTIVARNRTVRMTQIAAAISLLMFGGGLTWSHFEFQRHKAALMPLLTESVKTLELRARRQADRERISHTDLAAGATRLLEHMSRIDFPNYEHLFVPMSWTGVFEDELERAMTQSFQNVILTAIRLDLEEKTRSIIASSAPMRVVPVDPTRPVTPISPTLQPEAGATPVAANVFATLVQSEAEELAALYGDEQQEPGALLVVPGEQLAEEAKAPILAVSQMPEFIAWKRYIRTLRSVEDNARMFNQLSNTGDLKELGQLVAYSFEQQLPESFYKRSSLYRKALLNTNYGRFDSAAFSTEATERAEELAADFYAALFRRNPFAARLQQLGPAMQRATWRGAAAGETEVFLDLARRLRDIDLALSGTEVEWAFRSSFDLGHEFNSLLNDISASRFLGPSVAGRIREAGSSGWADLRSQLASSTTPLTGPILLHRNGRTEMRLSGDVLLLKYALDSFLGQGFLVANPRQRKLREVPRDARLTWNGALLDRAAAVSVAYDRFRDKHLELFPAELRIPIDQVARDRAALEMSDLLANAQSLEPIAAPGSMRLLEQELRLDITNFMAGVKPVTGILDAFSRLGSNESQRDVAVAMTAEALRLLQTVDRLLTGDQPYTPRNGNFAWWDGVAPPSPMAWGARDPAEVAGYLARSRGSVSALAHTFAEPLLVWFTKTGSMNRPDVRELVGKWQSVLDDLRDYDAKKPGNAIAALEDYVTTRMPKVSAADCTSAALPPGSGGRQSYFDATLENLSRELTLRCYAIASRDAATRYTELSRLFNQRLAGRYPFSEGPPKLDEPEADPADVRAFFRAFDSSKGIISATSADPALTTTFAAARRFVDQLAAVRTFFAPFLDAPKPDPIPSYDVEATFRVLRAREIEGDQIIDWSFALDEEVVTNRDTKTKLRWAPGKTVRFALRWAGNAPRVPAPITGSGTVSVKERTVVYEYTNRWSLLTALADHSVSLATLPDYTDVEPVTLGFSMYTQPAGGGERSEAPAQVFVRLALLAPGTTQSIDLPRFPARAPRLETAALAEEKQ
jgi:type VI secretion system protein ImpL